MDSWSTFQHPHGIRRRDGEVEAPRADGSTLKGVGQGRRQIRGPIPNLIVPQSLGGAERGRKQAPEKNF